MPYPMPLLPPVTNTKGAGTFLAQALAAATALRKALPDCGANPIIIVGTLQVCYIEYNKHPQLGMASSINNIHNSKNNPVLRGLNGRYCETVLRRANVFQYAHCTNHCEKLKEK